MSIDFFVQTSVFMHNIVERGLATVERAKAFLCADRGL